MLERFARFGSMVLRGAKQHRVGILVSFAVCLISLALYVAVYIVSHPSPLLQFLANVELKTLDMRFQLRGQVEPRSTGRDCRDRPEK